VPFSIRTAGPEDLPRLRIVYRRASLSNEGDRDALLKNPEYLELPGEAVFEGRTRVVEYSNTGIVGFATIDPQSSAAELVDLFVDPDYMRQGIARALIADAVARLAQAGTDELEVTANQHALAFYSAMGFEVVGTVATPLGSGLRMRLRIPHTSRDR
jgi:ribosomal protein S18 acetylase RimI-like enzyme